MNTLIFASNNRHKADEIRALLGDDFRIITLQDAGILIDIPEPHDTLEANAREKSTTIYRLSGQDCFSEDTGLETEALHGQPGVKSARYAGEQCTFEENIQKLLQQLQNSSNRKARFRTVISLILQGKEYTFEGICEGSILQEKRGDQGFGYDPVFVPEGCDRSFAEMDLTEKNKYSHRKKAMEKLLAFLGKK